jgi:hypothetical protein
MTDTITTPNCYHGSVPKWSSAPSHAGSVAEPSLFMSSSSPTSTTKVSHTYQLFNGFMDDSRFTGIFLPPSKPFGAMVCCTA